MSVKLFFKQKHIFFFKAVMESYMKNDYCPFIQNYIKLFLFIDFYPFLLTVNDEQQSEIFRSLRSWINLASSHGILC